MTSTDPLMQRGPILGPSSQVRLLHGRESVGSPLGGYQVQITVFLAEVRMQRGLYHNFDLAEFSSSLND